MIVTSNQYMGNMRAAGGWPIEHEIQLPYKINRNEEELELNPDYMGAKPSWAIWDWLEAHVADLHSEHDCGVAWVRTSKVFLFMFRDAKTAMLFKLTFG